MRIIKKAINITRWNCYDGWKVDDFVNEKGLPKFDILFLFVYN
jgi:hypothetical protein